MNKIKYKELLRLRQSEELMLFQIIEKSTAMGLTVRDVIKLTRIPPKRAWHILQKWANKDWYNYGVTLDLGWLTIQYVSWKGDKNAR